MAKVISPLFSFEASGKIADAMVFFTWKGRNVVRKWTIPTNPMTNDQGDIRLKLLSLAKGIKPALLTANLVTALKDFTPSGQIWNAYIIKVVMDQYLKGLTSYTALLSAFTNNTLVADWECAATGLEMVDQWLTYAAAATITPGQQMFQIAKGAKYLDMAGLPAGSPDTWVTAHIEQMATAFLESA